MKDLPFVEQAERQLYVGYDRDRRLRLSRLIAPLFATVLSLVLLAALIAPQQFRGTRSNYGTVLICDVLFVLAVVACRRRWVNVATGSILLAAVLLMVLSVLVNQPVILSDLFTVPAVVIIGLSALIGVPWMIPATTACATAFVLALARSPSLGKDLANPNNVNSVGAFVIELWLFALIIYVAARGYRRILRQISDVRVQYERARQLDELKDQFITTVNHELRNPVMLMQGYVELLRLKGEELGAERRVELVRRASLAGDTLANIVQTILSTRRVDQSARDFQPEAVSVLDTVATAASLVNSQDENTVQRDLRVHVAPEIAVWGDTVRLQQILVNLLSNAIKYSPPGTPVDITARVVAETPRRRARWRRAVADEHLSMVEIVVQDSGFGIPADQAPLLFQRFVRLPRDLASTTTGNGLGLYVCRELTEAMNGRIWVESSGIDGEGSSFYVRLPLPPQSEVPAEAP
jgi:signal transduction histidine kinase